MTEIPLGVADRGHALFLASLKKPTDSIGTRLDASSGLGKGFDFLRVALALLVVFVHCYDVYGRQDVQGPAIRFMNYWVLAVFFGLSGFLITGSALRLRLRDFIINRAIRIVPALLVDVVFAVVVIGAIFTTLPLQQYFFEPRVFSYFLNTVGDIHYFLPGVFESHPEVKVNLSLWTVPFEIACYVAMSLLIVSGSLKRPGVTVACALAVMALALAAEHYQFVTYGDVLITTAKEIAITQGPRLFVCFFLGIAAFQLRYWIPYNWRAFAICGIWCVVISFEPNLLLTRQSVLNVVAAPALIYLMAFIGVSAIPPLPLFQRGDYSYGIYLYGFPLQQVCYALFPHPRWAVLQFAIALPFVMAFAIFSWHVIEKPLLKIRKKFSFVARQRLAETAADAELAGAENNRPLPVESGQAN